MRSRDDDQDGSNIIYIPDTDDTAPPHSVAANAPAERGAASPQDDDIFVLTGAAPSSFPVTNTSAASDTASNASTTSIQDEDDMSDRIAEELSDELMTGENVPVTAALASLQQMQTDELRRINQEKQQAQALAKQQLDAVTAATIRAAIDEANRQANLRTQMVSNLATQLAPPAVSNSNANITYRLAREVIRSKETSVICSDDRNIENMRSMLRKQDDNYQMYQMILREDGLTNAEYRQQIIARYKEKRSKRKYEHKVTYTCRKTLADTRPRAGGRFTKMTEEEKRQRREREQKLIASQNGHTLKRPKLR